MEELINEIKAYLKNKSSKNKSSKNNDDVRDMSRRNSKKKKFSTYGYALCEIGDDKQIFCKGNIYRALYKFDKYDNQLIRNYLKDFEEDYYREGCAQRCIDSDSDSDGDDCSYDNPICLYKKGTAKINVIVDDIINFYGKNYDPYTHLPYIRNAKML